MNNMVLSLFDQSEDKKMRWFIIENIYFQALLL